MLRLTIIISSKRSQSCRISINDCKKEIVTRNSFWLFAPSSINDIEWIGKCDRRQSKDKWESGHVLDDFCDHADEWGCWMENSKEIEQFNPKQERCCRTKHTACMERAIEHIVGWERYHHDSWHYINEIPEESDGNEVFFPLENDLSNFQEYQE